jgi:hypothetical protein
MANASASPNQFFLGIDTEISSSAMSRASLINGVNCNSSAPLFLKITVGSTAISAYQHVLNCYALYDVVFQIDTVNKTCIAVY